MSPPAASPRQLLVGYVAVLLLVALVHAGGLRGQFLDWDDTTHVTQNPTIRALTLDNLRAMFTQPIAKLYCPLTWLSFALDYQLWGRDPWGYHLTNLLLHLANVALVIHLVLQLPALPHNSRLPIALLTATFFGIHPLRVESVAWITERKDVLFALFYLAGLLAYRHWQRTGQVTGYLGAIGCGLASALSKSAGVTFPAALLLLDALHRRRLLWWNKLPFFAISALVTVATVRAQAAGAGDTVVATDLIPLWARAGLVGYCSLFYVAKTFWPVRLSAIYPTFDEMTYTPATAALHLLALLLVTGGVILLRKRLPVLLPAWAFYLITLSPTIGLVPVGIHVVADRFSYLPSLGLSLPVAWLVARYRQAWLPAAMAVTLLGWLTLERTPVWRDTGTLFQSVLRTQPDSLPALLKLTTWHIQRREWDAAVARGEHALRVAPTSRFAVKNLARAYQGAGRHADVIRLLRAPAEQGVADPVVWELLADSFAALGDTGNAAAARQRLQALQNASD